jgi:hypothetical protein
MSSDRAQDRAPDLDGDDGWRSAPVVEVLLDDNTSKRRARRRAKPSRPTTQRRTVRSTIGVLAIGALGGFVVSQALARPDQPAATVVRDTTVSVAHDPTDCRSRPRGCTTEEYRGPSASAHIASAVAKIGTHAPLDCQIRAGRCSTEAYRLVPATAITLEPSGGIEP